MKNSHFDSLIHAPNRLHICVILSTSDEIEFKLLRERLDVSDSVLSKHIKSLEEAGYVAVAKRRDFGHRRTWVSLTSAGRGAYTEHVKELKRIVGRYQAPPSSLLLERFFVSIFLSQDQCAGLHIAWKDLHIDHALNQIVSGTDKIIFCHL